MRYLVLLGLFCGGLALAQSDYPRDITLSWTNPSQYVDGSVIEAGDLDQIVIDCFRNNDTVPAFSQSVADSGEGQPQSETFVAVVPSPGTYTCVAYAVVVDGTSSDASNPAVKKYIGKPMPPQDFN